MNYAIQKNKFVQVLAVAIVGIFLLSSYAMADSQPLILTTTSSTPLQPVGNQNMNLASSLSANSAKAETNLQKNLDSALFNWVNSSTPLNPSMYRMDQYNNPVVTVFAQPGANLKDVNKYMNVNSFVDLGMYGYIILGSISSVNNLVSLTQTNPYIKVSSDPYGSYLDSLYVNQTTPNSPNNLVSNNQMFINQANAMNCGGQSCNGTGVTIAMVDGGTDFGNSDLQGALALNATGLPKSFDTEGWSLVATPLTVGKDIPLSKNNKTLLFSQVNSTTLDKLKINDPTYQNWSFWNTYENFMAPQNWAINSSWVGHPGQAPPKFGVGVEHWQDLNTGQLFYGYIYALVLDLNHDGLYDSVVIDMATSAWASYLKYVADGGHVGPMSAITPDFNFSNDKVVTWESNIARGSVATGKDYTFAVDWNGDGVNDWSYGSLANAYNRYNFLPINQTKYGKIVPGVDPSGAGFSALYPYANGFSEHGTWTASVAVSRGLVNYNVFSNNSGSWDYPYGNASTRTLPGAASGASLMSITFGASPQDELIAWFWAAGFNLNSTISSNTAGITGAEWTWSGSVRANITSNSWGIDGLYWGGFWGTDWLSDLLSMTNLGGGTHYIRNIADLWSSDVATGSSTGANVNSINYTSPFVPYTSLSTSNSMYIGGNNRYQGIGLNVTVPDSSLTITSAEYYNGKQWKTLTITQPPLGTKGIDWLYFNASSDWALASFNSTVNDLYWIRLSVTQTSSLEISNILFDFKNPYYGYPGMLMVTAAGNGNYYQSIGSPFGTLTLKVGAASSSAAYANQFGPNWQTTQDQMAFFSSAGPKASGAPAVDIVAPGSIIYSGTPLYRSIIDNRFGAGDISQYGGNGTNAFVVWQGTSASTPAVAGVAAIAYQAYMSSHPGKEVNPLVIKQIIKSTATNLNYPENVQGAGFINASAVVDFIQNNSSSRYFLLGSNTTYESQLNITSWLSNLGLFYWYYAYSAQDTFSDVFGFPVTRNTLLANYHSDSDLSTYTITKGDTFNTQVSAAYNSSTLTVQPVHSTNTTPITKNFLVGSNDQFLTSQGDYAVNLSLANLPIWSGNYIEITVTGLSDFANVSLFTWHDFNGDGIIEEANPNNPQTNGSGELAKVQYDYTNPFRDFGLLKIGNPSQYNTTFSHPYLILKGDSSKVDIYKSHWAQGMIIGVSIKVFNLYSSWSNAITVTPVQTANNVTTFDVSIDTASMQPGFNLGFLKFTDQATNYVEYMPLSVKVAYPVLDQKSSTPTMIGTYQIDHTGTPYQIGFQGGPLIWVPFSVNASQTTTNSVLAIRITQLSPSDSSSDLGMVLHYDETPNYFDANYFQIFESSHSTGTFNGSTVNWQYIPWGSVGFSQGDFISRFGYFRYQAKTDNQIFYYRLGLFITNASAPTTVKVELYWLPSMPVTFSQVSASQPAFSYCQDTYQSMCLQTTNAIIGPNANLTIATNCTNCDPNLPTPTVLFGKEAYTTNLTSGTFSQGFNTGYSIDHWEKRYFNAGDVVEFSDLPTSSSATLNTWVYSPTTISTFGVPSKLPITDLGYLLSADYAFGEYGSFIASTSGYYWFGIDNFGTTNTGWVLFTKASYGSLSNLGTGTADFNTFTNSNFGLPTEATFNIQTGVYDNVTNIVVGAYTPTGLSTNPYSVNLAVDNLVAPFVQLGNESLALNNTIVDRSQGNITFDWSLLDLNGNSAVSQIILQGPFSNDVYTSSPLTTTKATWDFSSNKTYPDGWWTVAIVGNDAGDPSNTINGVNYGGYGFPVFFRIFLQEGSNQTVTTTAGSDLLSTIGFTAFGALIGGSAVALGVLTYTRRTEIKTRYNEVRDRVRNEISKRKGPKE